MKRLSPAEIEEMKRTLWEPDPHYIAKVLSELLSRQYGYEVEMILTPKAKDDCGE